MHRGIESNREAWLKQDIDMNREPKKKKKEKCKKWSGKKNFQVNFFLNNAVFGKTKRCQVCNNRSNKKLFGVRTKLISNLYGKFISYKNEKCLTILEIYKTVMYEFLYLKLFQCS